MTITQLKKHDDCQVRIVFGSINHHTAYLECVDPRCTSKSKWIQWLSHETADNLKDLGVPVVNTSQIWLSKKG